MARTGGAAAGSEAWGAGGEARYGGAYEARYPPAYAAPPPAAPYPDRYPPAARDYLRKYWRARAVCSAFDCHLRDMFCAHSSELFSFPALVKRQDMTLISEDANFFDVKKWGELRLGALDMAGRQTHIYLYTTKHLMVLLTGYSYDFHKVLMLPCRQRTTDWLTPSITDYYWLN